ncbi:hypothetical protein NECAME_05212, partial [Necator americanus]
DGDAENSDETSDLSNIEGLIEHCANLVEAKYLMQHLFNACLEHAVAAAKADSLNKESEARIQQLEQQSYINEQLLSTVIEDKTLNEINIDVVAVDLNVFILFRDDRLVAAGVVCRAVICMLNPVVRMNLVFLSAKCEDFP